MPSATVVSAIGQFCHDQLCCTHWSTPLHNWPLQLALELVQAQHTAAECQASADTQKAQLAEAKAAQQAQLVASLDAKLQAAHAALDASCAAVMEWRRGGAALLEHYARLLHGQEPLPGAYACSLWHPGPFYVAYSAHCIVHVLAHAHVSHPSCPELIDLW